MQAMKGATMALGSMNRQMNLPGLAKIAMEFERENDIMEQRQEMMDDAIDDAMDVGAEEEGEEVVEQILEEIGVDLNHAVSIFPSYVVRFTATEPTFTNKIKYSWARPQPACRLLPCQKERLRRLLGKTMTCRRDWTA